MKKVSIAMFMFIAAGFVFAVLVSNTSAAQLITAGVVSSSVAPIEVVPIEPSPRIIDPTPVPLPLPLCRTVKVTPGDPLHLSGTGRVVARGRGETQLNIRRGYVKYEGQGVVAVKVSNNDTVEVSGYGHKMKMGRWVLYWGKGELTVKGDKFKVVSYGKFEITARGTGSARFKGWWKVHYCRLLIAKPVPILDVIPTYIRQEVTEQIY